MVTSHKSLVVNNLVKSFVSRPWFGKSQTFVAVKGISFAVQQGEILGLLGPNGAGKTTTIQMLLGTLSPTSGSIVYFGQDFSTHRAQILKKVTSASSYDKLPARLPVWDNLDIFGRIYSIPHAKRVEKITQLLKFFGIWHLRSKPAGTLSAGQSTRLMLAKAFLPDPAMVLLDEPTAALDPDVAQEVRQFILEQKNRYGTSFLFTSHNMDEVTDVCDRILVLKNGIIIADDKPQQLAASVAISRIHLMVTHGRDILMGLLHQHQAKYIIHEHSIEIEIDEASVAPFLMAVAHHNIVYSQISIDKPTLEDYFLSVVKK